ncbi:MAG: protein kinase [Planctomycetota bacterium]|nr:protein kinase [Planctomycetota bacterium]
MADESGKAAGIPDDLKTIGEHYHLTEKLGEGAFGNVYTAHHELLDQDFAVKVLKPELCADEATRERFLDEARALIRFSHPNVVQLRHVGEHNRQLYLVMDLVRGQPLDEIMLSGKPFPEARAVGIAMQVLAGLEAAHAAGIVHRDLKPSNLILEQKPDGSDHVRILDFGLSKLSTIDGHEGTRRSVTGSIIGTLAYMSPEQLSGEEEIDGRADLFATGLLLHEMLQGQHPYPGESGIVVAAKLLRDPVPALPQKIQSKLTPSTSTALSTALERDRDARYMSATAFRQALLGKGPPSDTSRVTTIEHARQELARREAAERSSSRKSPGQKRGLLAGVGVLVVAIAVGAFVMFNKNDGDAGSGATVADNGKKPAAPDEPAPKATGPGPEQPEIVKQPDTPAQPETPEQPATPDTPTPAAPDQPELPDKPTPPVEPAQPDPTAPEQPEIPSAPVQPEQPEVPPETPDQPAPAAPDQPETPAQPEAPAMPSQPGACCVEAAKHLAEGEWAEARRYYFHTLEKLDGDWLPALRGAAESYLTEADLLARAGKVTDALALLDESIEWSGAAYDRYADDKVAHATKQLQLGYARLYRGQAHLERARWLRIEGGQADAAAAALKASKDDFQFAAQQLEKEGLDDAEMRMRRAELSRFEGQTMPMLGDLQWITQEANESVIHAYMWVAHANTLRRLGEAGLWKQGDRRQEAAFAENAWQIARKGASYKEKELSKRGWLALCRVIWVRAMYESDPVKLQSLGSMLRWWLQLAQKAPALAYESTDLTAARELTAQAMLEYVNALAHHRGGKGEPAKTAFEKAAALAREAIAKREAVAKNEERLASSLPHRVLGFALMGLGTKNEASAAFAAGRKADLTNPD